MFTFAFQTVVKEGQNESLLSQRVKSFMTEGAASTRRALYVILYILAFEEHKNLWVFAKPLLPTMLVNEKFIDDVKKELLAMELNEEVRTRLNDGMQMLMEGIERSLEQKNKDLFQNNFNKVKRSLMRDSEN